MYQIQHFSCNKAYFGVFFWLRVFRDYNPCYVCKRGWGLCLRGPGGEPATYPGKQGYLWVPLMMTIESHTLRGGQRQGSYPQILSHFGPIFLDTSECHHFILTYALSATVLKHLWGSETFSLPSLRFPWTWIFKPPYREDTPPAKWHLHQK